VKAFFLTRPGRGEFREVPPPRVGPEDVLLRVEAVGLCGSDLNTWRGRNPLVAYPRVPGHEIGGVILRKGRRVPATPAVGSRATVVPYTACGRCSACRAGRPNGCRRNRTLGVQRDGALAERLSVPFTRVFTSARLSAEELALVEPLGVGWHAVNRARVTEADTVLVIGCGTVGLGAVAAADERGARVIALDVAEGKLETARRFGAAKVVHAVGDDPAARLRRATRGRAPAVVIEAVGRPETYRLAIEAVGYAGRVACIGYSPAPVSLDTKEIVRKELDVLGSRNSLGVFRAVIRMMHRREKPFGELVTATYPFAEAARAFADWDAHPDRVHKIIVRVSE